MKKTYKYDNGKGNMVSRQRLHQMRNPEKTRALQKKYYDAHREELTAKTRAWLAKFKEEHDGVSYHTYRRRLKEQDS